VVGEQGVGREEIRSAGCKAAFLCMNWRWKNLDRERDVDVER
jgi:hypothetical protein